MQMNVRKLPMCAARVHRQAARVHPDDVVARRERTALPAGSGCCTGGASLGGSVGSGVSRILERQPSSRRMTIGSAVRVPAVTASCVPARRVLG